jgi:hypothetical protein
MKLKEPEIYTMLLTVSTCRFGQTEMPVSNDVWDVAIKTWDTEKI